jgi:AcrR family transcriptional regulator
VTQQAAAAHDRTRSLVTQQTGPNKSDSTRLDDIAAADRELATKPYSRVDLDDILALADPTKSAMYTHFRSKNALAAAIVAHRALLACQASPTPNRWNISAASSDTGPHSRSRLQCHHATAIYDRPNKLITIDWDD